MQGKVYIVHKKDDHKKTPMIIKTYAKSANRCFKKEKQVLEKIKSAHLCSQGFPQLISTKTDSTTSELLMEALGKNLKDVLLNSPNKTFPPFYAFKIILQLIERIKNLHQIGFVHGDLKLQNIVQHSEDTNRIFLIDFGSSFSYFND